MINYFNGSIVSVIQGDEFRIRSDFVVVGKKIFDRILLPVGTGVFAGVADFALGCSTAVVLSLMGVPSIGYGSPLFSISAANSTWIPWIENCIAPIAEELIFRGFLQGGTTWVIHRIVPNLGQEMGFLDIRISRAALASIMTTALLFGLAHDLYMLNVVRVVVCVVSGLVFGVIREQVGLLGSTSAHIVTNLLV